MTESMSRGIEFNTPQYLVAANTIIYAGDMVAIATSGGNAGYAVPVSATTGLKCKGIATATVDNTTGNTVGNSGLAGGAAVPVELSFSDKGLRAYRVASDTGGNVVAQTAVGTPVYGKDAKTVTTNSSGTSVVAEVFRIDSDGTPVVIFNQ